MKAIADEKLAKFVESQLKEIDNHLLRVGGFVQQAVRDMEELAQIQFQLKRAIRTGEYQLPLWPTLGEPSPDSRGLGKADKPID